MTGAIVVRHLRAGSAVTPTVLGTRTGMMLIPYWWQNPTAFAELLDGRRRVQPSAAHAGRRAIAGDILRHVGGATITTPSRIALTGVAPVALDLRGVRRNCEDVVARVSEPDRSGGRLHGAA